ncbi:MAG: 30S ribosomal protein S12 methylthiotransferase RimO [Firmicutes bacterium]|nr:30S ribosomal protein S12 methylthiotransferase RimO [Bacillota bacterium]
MELTNRKRPIAKQYKEGRQNTPDNSLSADYSPTIFLLSLGCSKNLVDSEGMRGLIAEQGWQLTDTPKKAQVIIVNTCGFIQPAQEESIAALLDAANYKNVGVCQLLIAVGCLVEKYRTELQQELPEIDAFLGSSEYGLIAQLVAEKLGLPSVFACNLADIYAKRLNISPPWLAYIKIAEGCDNHCSYCLIPQLRGAYKSRPMEDILLEARRLAQDGVKELVLLAQDTTAYGLDISGQRLLSKLLIQLADMPFMWIRLLYAYPDGVDEVLLKVMASHDNICPYLDIPLQHGDDNILRAMGRSLNSAQLREKIDLIRRYIPNIAIRTTMMVGFPGETEEAFSAMLEFVRWARFDWLGAFAYCREEDTIAYNLPDQIDKETKNRRLELLLQEAAHLSDERLKNYIGRTLTVLTEASAKEEYGSGWWRGRSVYQAPEVDGAVYFVAEDINPGEIVSIHITGNDVFDLLGKKLSNIKER